MLLCLTRYFLLAAADIFTPRFDVATLRRRLLMLLMLLIRHTMLPLCCHIILLFADAAPRHAVDRYMLPCAATPLFQYAPEGCHFFATLLLRHAIS